MIVSRDGSTLLTAARGALMMTRVADRSATTMHLATGPLIRLVSGSSDAFAVLHHTFTRPSVRTITAHRLSDPATAVATLQVSGDLAVSGTGDPDIWCDLPQLYSLAYPFVLHLTPTSARVVTLPAPAASAEEDEPYKVVISPDQRHVIVADGRAGGRFTVFDLVHHERVAELDLGNGPPTFRFQPGTGLVWLAHADNVFQIDPTDWSVVTEARLRAQPGTGTISDMAFDISGDRCAIALSDKVPVPLLQPFRMGPVDGEVRVLETASLNTTAAAPTERWVDELALVGANEVAVFERSSAEPVRFLRLTRLEPHEPTRP